MWGGALFFLLPAVGVKNINCARERNARCGWEGRRGEKSHFPAAGGEEGRRNNLIWSASDLPPLLASAAFGACVCKLWASGEKASTSRANVEKSGSCIYCDDLFSPRKVVVLQKYFFPKSSSIEPCT